MELDLNDLSNLREQTYKKTRRQGNSLVCVNKFIKDQDCKFQAGKLKLDNEIIL